MKAGLIGNPELQALVLARDPGLAVHPEIVAIEDEDVKVTAADWAEGTQDPLSSLEILQSGGAQLAAFTTDDLPANANDGTNVTRLTHIPTYDAVVVEWLDQGASDRELHNLVARLDPRRDGGQPKTVAEWRAQLFRVSEVLPGGIDEGGVVLLPISLEVVVSATGEVAADFTFNFQGQSGAYPRVGPPATNAPPNSRPLTLIRIIALRDDGSPADNVTWLADSGVTTQTDGTTYLATPYAVGRLLAVTGDHIGGSAHRLLPGGAYPEFTLNRVEHLAPADVTFEGAAEVPDLSGSGALTIVARGETPADSELTYEISDDGGASWEECFDGDVIGEDNGAQGGGDLSAISTTGPWDMRVTLTPSSTGFLTPVVREVGVQRSTSIWLTGRATLYGGHRQVDPVTLRGNIAAAELEILKSGEADYRDIGSRILSSYHIGEIQVRLWLGATERNSLPRRKWMLDSVWDIDDYVSTETAHRLMLVSPLRRLRNVIIPPFVVTSGTDGERVAREVPSSAGTIKDAYDEIIDGMVGLAGRLRGPSPDDDTNSARKLIVRSEAKEELDRLAYLSAGSIIESQGRIGFVKMMRDGPGGDTPVALFPWGTYTPGDFGPGYSTRTDEFFVPFNYDDSRRIFEDERRYLNAVALLKLGGVGLNTTQRLDDETCQWIVSEDLANLVGRRVPNHFATGQIVWPIRSHYRHPELEPGDPIAIETMRFVGRSPLGDEEIRGRVWASAIVTQVRDPMGQDLEVWVPSFDKIVVAEGDVTPEGFFQSIAPFYSSATPGNVTGTTAETLLRTVTVPARSMGKRGGFEIKVLVDITGTASSKSIRVKWAGTNIILASYGSGETGLGELVGRVYNKDDFAAQRSVGRNVKAGASGYSYNDHTEDTTQDVDIEITGQLGNAADEIELVDVVLQYFGGG